ncbi:M48 family metallopeptidase [Actinoplanes sp. NPDC051411]|uniref:M48 family metallopeptidase n=1 Tax=Actinoplanes sp. NPDC051411 TaxID=3155522 RepID=UPI003442460D
MQTIMGDGCPTCRGSLTSVGDAVPWCGSCEWNLDTFPDNRSDTWFWRRARRAERRAGFRSDRHLAGSAEPLPIGGHAYAVLLALSMLLLLADVALAVSGAWLILSDPWFWPIAGGLILIGIAALLRPRLGRLKPLLAHGYVVERRNAPTLHRMIDRLVTDLGAPRPDLVVFDFDWNAGVTRVGLRQTRVLVLGVPLLLALTPQQVVALVGHELGHLRYEDNRRRLVLQPAATVFGRLARAVKPPHRAVQVAQNNHPLVAYALLIWQLVGGSAYLLLSTVHLAVNGVIAAQNRAMELRADQMAARAAGTAAALEALDTMTLLPILSGYLQHHVEKGEAAARWRRYMGSVRGRHIDSLPARRQLSMRTAASVLADHPAAGRRHQWLSSQPAQAPGLLIEEAAGVRLEKEIAPYAEILHREMLDRVIV